VKTRGKRKERGKDFPAENRGKEKRLLVGSALNTF